MDDYDSKLYHMDQLLEKENERHKEYLLKDYENF